MNDLDEKTVADLRSQLHERYLDLSPALSLPAGIRRRIRVRRLWKVATGAGMVAILVAALIPLMGLRGSTVGSDPVVPASRSAAGAGPMVDLSGGTRVPADPTAPGTVFATGLDPLGVPWTLSMRPKPGEAPEFWITGGGTSAGFGTSGRVRGGSTDPKHLPPYALPDGVVSGLPQFPAPGDAMSPLGGGAGVSPNLAVEAAWVRGDVSRASFTQTHGSPVPFAMTPLLIPGAPITGNDLQLLILFDPTSSDTFGGTVAAVDASGAVIDTAAIGSWIPWTPAPSADARIAQDTLELLILRFTDWGGGFGTPPLAAFDAATGRSVEPSLIWDDSSVGVPGEVSVRQGTDTSLLLIIDTPAGNSYCLAYIFHQAADGSSSDHFRVGVGDVATAGDCNNGLPFDSGQDFQASLQHG